MPCRSSPTAGPGGASRLRAQCWSGSRRALRISGLLAGFGLLIGLAVAPTVAYYGSIDPRALWEAGGAPALFIAGFGAVGYATRRDLTAVARVCFWALLALIVAGIVLIFVHIPGADLAYSVLGVLANGSGPAVLLLARALTPIGGLTMRIRKHPLTPLAAVTVGLLAGAVGTVCLNAVHYLKYRRAGSTRRAGTTSPPVCQACQRPLSGRSG